jgi:hypothetical protein
MALDAIMWAGCEHRRSSCAIFSRGSKLMLMSSGKSGLVRLSDSLKTLLDLCEGSTAKLLSLSDPHMSAYRRVRQLAKEALARGVTGGDNEREMLEAIKDVPLETQVELARLSSHEVHSLALSCVLFSCFCLESYINSFAHFFA